MHKTSYIGGSGVVFTVCGEVASKQEYIKSTYRDDLVDCGQCLKLMAENAPEEE